MRPTSLRDVALARGADLWIPLDEFLDEFYQAYPGQDEMSRMLTEAPPLFGVAFLDSYLAAVAEHLAIRWNLEKPAWVDDERRMGSSHPNFAPDLAELRGILLVESPYAFRRRNIFTIEEPLQRARWPADVVVYQPLGPAAAV